MINPEFIIDLPDDALKAFGAVADTLDCGTLPCCQCPYILDRKQMRIMYRNVPRLANINCSFILCKHIAT